MVNYKLGIINNGIKEINLDSLTTIKDLKYLDKLTSSFKSEVELKEFLYRKGIISNNDLKGYIRVVYKYKNSEKMLKVIYRDDFKYLDSEYLRSIIMSLSNDIDFLVQLANHYDNNNIGYLQKDNVSDIRAYIRSVRLNNNRTYYSSMLYSAINDLFKRATSTYSKDSSEYIENYRTLRDLAIFIINYQNKYDIKKYSNKDNSNNLSSQILFTDFIDDLDKKIKRKI